MMSRPIKSQTSPLYVMAKEAIMELVNEDSFPGGKLPSEAVLSESLGISRTTIREALITLHREGIITKQHGLGNLIHRSTLGTKMQIDRFSDFKALLKDGGYEADVARSEQEWVRNLEPFGLEDPEQTENERYLYVESIYSADAKAAILSQNFIKESVLRKDIGDKKNVPESSFVELLNLFSKEEVANTIIAFKPSVVDNVVSEKLCLGKGLPVMQWQETSYSVFDRVICLGKITFHPELVNLTLLRKWK